MVGNRSDGKTPSIEEAFPWRHNRFRLAAGLIMALLVLVLTACAGHPLRSEPTRGVYHQVKKGETLWGIAKAYHVNLQELAELNNITKNTIEVGNAIFIPGAVEVIENTSAVERQKAPKKQPTVKTTAAAPAPPPRKTKQPVASPPAKEPIAAAKKIPDKVHEANNQREQIDKHEESTPTVEIDKARFIWPMKGAIVSRYGIQSNGLKNNGVRIAGDENTPIKAAADGEVTYSSTLKYYGDTIILKHGDDFSTVYSSLKGRTVKVGDHVKKGETIALLGKTDNGGETSLNFEVRQQNKPRNPLFFLP